MKPLDGVRLERLGRQPTEGGYQSMAIGFIRRRWRRPCCDAAEDISVGRGVATFGVDTLAGIPAAKVSGFYVLVPRSRLGVRIVAAFCNWLKREEWSAWPVHGERRHMLNDPRTHGIWEVSAPPPPGTQPLTGDAFADVAIVGAGYTGCSTALHLVERGIDAAVLEAVDIGYGAAGRSSGLVNAGLWVMPSALRQSLGPVYGERLLELLTYSPRTVFDVIEKYDIPCELVRSGTIHCAAGRSGDANIKERVRQWQERGAPVTLLGAGEMREKIGTSAYTTGLLDMRAGTVQPLAYVRGLARAALTAGARVFTNSPVKQILRDGNTWRLVTPQGSLCARKVVLASDAYTAHIMPELRTSQVRVAIFQVATAPLGDNVRRQILPEGHATWDTRTVPIGLRTEATGRLIVNCVGALRNTGIAVHTAWARRRAAACFPQRGDVAFEHE